MQWMKLSALSFPEDFVLLNGASAVVAELHKDTRELQSDLRVATFDMERGVFIAEGTTVQQTLPDTEIEFLVIPKLS
jgi:hypothetical protein